VQEEALARLHFLVEERRTLGLLLGEAGSGKSLVLEVFARELGVVNVQKALVNVAGIGRREFLWETCGQMGVEVPCAAGEFALYRALADALVAGRCQQMASVLLVDDADQGRGEVLDEILRLVQLNQASDLGLTVVLSARPHALARLGERLLEQAELRVDLEGWEFDDSAAFVKKSLADAGRSSPIFSEAAMHRLHDLAGGLPRRIKQLADLALVAGAGANLPQIEAETIEAAYGELGPIMPRGAVAPRATV
jgi:type II secretory pathway predicted ATPase ExeA